MVTVDDYNELAVQAARSVLLEILRVLGEYKDSIVLIGGWVPQMLFPNSEDLHTGSIDVDLAMDHEKLTDEGYRSIKNKLVREGLEKLAKNFASTEHTGPRFVSDFQNVADEEERAMLERDVFERVDFLLRKLGIV